MVEIPPPVPSHFLSLSPFPRPGDPTICATLMQMTTRTSTHSRFWCAYYPTCPVRQGVFFEPVTAQTVTAVHKLGFILCNPLKKNLFGTLKLIGNLRPTDWIGQPDLDDYGVIEMATTRTIKFRFPIKESADWTLWDLFESSDCVAISLIREFTTNNIFTDAHCTVH